MATLDHIGLNRYIYMSASVDEMTLGSFDMTEIDKEKLLAEVRKSHLINN